MALTIEPSLHDIARGTTGCGDDDEPFTIEEAASFDTWLDDVYVRRTHQHDFLCYGTGEYASELRCGQ